jgi:hypothetical protein
MMADWAAKLHGPRHPFQTSPLPIFAVMTGRGMGGGWDDIGEGASFFCRSVLFLNCEIKATDRQVVSNLIRFISLIQSFYPGLG